MSLRIRSSKANEMSKDINAKAFTHGSDIYFKEGNYNPNTGEGKNLLGHELAHTQQQKGGLQRKPEDGGKDKRKKERMNALIQKSLRDYQTEYGIKPPLLFRVPAKKAARLWEYFADYLLENGIGL